MNQGDTVAIGWCDNGTTDGSFTEGMMEIALAGKNTGFPIETFVRVQGNQIAKQRQTLLDFWYDKTKTDWLFWVDSDIVLTQYVWSKLCSAADAKKRPIVSGVYFIAKENDDSLPILLPCIFNDVDESTVMYHHPLPENKIIKIDSAGMGLVIMHRSVVTKLKKEYGDKSFLFEENNLAGEDFVGEDIAFFRKCKKINIPVYADTAAVAKHIKRTQWDTQLYALYWNNRFNQNKNTPPN